MFAALAIPISTAASAQTAQTAIPPIGNALRNPVTSPSSKDCKSNDPDSVVVCGRSQHLYRIDPDVLAAERAAEAPPIRAPLTADDAQTACIGAQCGTGGVVPFIGMALIAATAVAMAADGDDWREVFRTRQEQYQAYLDAKARQKKERRVQILGGIASK
ncbi:MAG TPA: hypothetical protein VFW39_12195 [Sphingomicrobium sp.]|nr:hypothetical protein [Sphingomicrobium sp.]